MTQPNYFTLSFWRQTVNHMIFGAATNAVNAWTFGAIGSTDNNLHLSIPGMIVAYAALSGAALAFLLSLLGQAFPGTADASLVPKARSTRTASKRTGRSSAR